METRSLGTSGLEVRVLSLGAMTFGESSTFMKGVTSSDEWKDTNIAEKRDASCAQVALAWLLAKKEVSTIIIGARTTQQLDDPYSMIARSQQW